MNDHDRAFIENTMQKCEGFRLPDAVKLEVAARFKELTAAKNDPEEMDAIAPLVLLFIALSIEFDDQKVLTHTKDEYLELCAGVWDRAQDAPPGTSIQDFLIRVSRRLSAEVKA